MSFKIKVVGVGGAGSKFVDRMISTNVGNVEYCVMNTDFKSLKTSLSNMKIKIGTDGFGAGGVPDTAEKCAIEDKTKIIEAIKDTDLLIITCGMGGGTGTGVVPIIARISKELGILTVAVVTRPFTFEGKKRIENANIGIDKIKQYTDSVIAIPDDKIFPDIDSKSPIEEMFKKIDDVIKNFIQSISVIQLKQQI